MLVKIALNDKENPPGKLADAELHFTDGVLEGLKLLGFPGQPLENGDFTPRAKDSLWPQRADLEAPLLMLFAWTLPRSHSARLDREHRTVL